jgi:hypothetical protein
MDLAGKNARAYFFTVEYFLRYISVKGIGHFYFLHFLAAATFLRRFAKTPVPRVGVTTVVVAGRLSM